MNRTSRKPESYGKGSSSFADVVALWHMADLSDSAGKSPLTVHGDVKVGVRLTGRGRGASLERGGDGCAAEFQGGYLVAGVDAEEPLNLTGKEMTFCIRLMDAQVKWNAHLFGTYDGEDPLSARAAIAANDASQQLVVVSQEVGPPHGRWRVRILAQQYACGAALLLPPREAAHSIHEQHVVRRQA